MISDNLPTQRQMRFGELIRSIISKEIITGDLYNADFNLSVITISFVKMSKDLKIASVYVIPIGGENKEKIIKYLNDNRNFFQKSISRAKLKSKFTPKIIFYLDNSFDEAERITNLLKNEKVMKDLKNE
tara:strand:- start:491 stop:877 length:387 start_codon:yes stop_codon:yes gene_type:complete